jgi:hypothetical protein
MMQQQQQQQQQQLPSRDNTGEKVKETSQKEDVATQIKAKRLDDICRLRRWLRPEHLIILLDWINGIGLQYKLEETVQFCAQQMCLRCLEIEQLQISRTTLQAVAVVCLLIQNKLLDDSDTLGLKEAAAMCDGAYRVGELRVLETEVLQLFDYDSCAMVPAANVVFSYPGILSLIRRRFLLNYAQRCGDGVDLDLSHKLSLAEGWVLLGNNLFPESSLYDEEEEEEVFNLATTIVDEDRKTRNVSVNEGDGSELTHLATTGCLPLSCLWCA